MDNKNIFEKSKKPTFYILAALSVAVIGAVSFISYNALKKDNVKAPVEDQTPVEQTTPMEQSAPTDTEPDQPVVDTPETEQSAPENEQSTPQSTPTVKAEPINYIMPCDGEITVSFSLDTPVYSVTLGDWRIHDGIDISAPAGSDVVAVADGVVEEIERDDLLGVTVVIKHTDGKRSVYSNLEDSVELEKGQIINQKDIVGKIGETAVYEIADGPHLHFKMTESGKAIDPTEILKADK